MRLGSLMRSWLLLRMWLSNYSLGQNLLRLRPISLPRGVQRLIARGYGLLRRISLVVVVLVLRHYFVRVLVVSILLLYQITGRGRLIAEELIRWLRLTLLVMHLVVVWGRHVYHLMSTNSALLRLRERLMVGCRHHEANSVVRGTVCRSLSCQRLLLFL